MKYFFLLILLCSVFSFVENNEAPGLQIWLEDQEGAHYCTAIYIQSINSQYIPIGTSSIYIEYDEAIHQFISYTPVWFDDEMKCEALPLSGYRPQSYYTEYAGVVNITITNTHPVLACPTVGETPVEVGELCFEPIGASTDSSIKINAEHTHFNVASIEAQAIENIIILD